MDVVFILKKLQESANHLQSSNALTYQELENTYVPVVRELMRYMTLTPDS
jgi:hypothetical protein